MQEEVKKHTKKIYNTIKNPKNSMTEKIKEVLIEILIIVFAVTFSIWLHSLSEHRHQQKEVSEFFTDLKDDLKNDIESVSKSKDKLTMNIKDYKFVLGLSQIQIDSLKRAHGTVAINSTILTTKINNGNYEGFKSSGKMGYIENKKLKRLILKYYQEQSLRLLEAEKHVTATYERVINFVGDNSDKEFDKIIMMPQFKFQLRIYIDQTNGLVEGYSQSVKDAREIINELNANKF